MSSTNNSFIAKQPFQNSNILVLKNLQKSEDMKNKGNEQFRKNKFQVALKWYTKAIKYQ